MKRIIETVAVILVITLATATVYGQSAIDIDVNDFEETMIVGSTQNITVVVYPNDADDSVKYSSSNPSVATVSPGGKIEAKSKGKTTITVSAGKVKKSMKLTVEVHTSKILVNSRYITLKKGEKFNIKASVLPADAAQGISYTSEDPAIASVDNNGQIKAVGNGDTSVFVSNGDLSESITVIVNSSSSGTDAINFDTYPQDKDNAESGAAGQTKNSIKAASNGIIEEETLQKLKETGETFTSRGDSYELFIDGKYIVNCGNEFNTDIYLRQTDKGIEFELNNGKPLPGEVRIKFAGRYTEPLRYIYFNSRKTDSKEYFGELKELSFKTDIEGYYYITYEKEKKFNIGTKAIVASAAALCTLIILYIISKRRYWFW